MIPQPSPGPPLQREVAPSSIPGESPLARVAFSGNCCPGAGGGAVNKGLSPSPSQCGHLLGRGQTKYSEREIEASPIGGSQNTPGEKLPFSGLRGPSTGPRYSPRPLQVSRTRGLSGRGLAPRGVSPRAAPGRRESARQPERAAGWAHLGRAKRFSRS